MPTGGRLRNRTAIVTGGAQGLGRAIAETFVREGARVVIADLDGAKAAASAAALGRRGGAVRAVQADLTREADVRRVVEAVGRSGRIDVLVNNVGAYPRRPWLDLSAAEWRHWMDVNLLSHVLCSQAVAPVMKRRRRGSIVNLSSVTFFLGFPDDLVHYNAAKGGVIGLTRSLARDLGPHGIRVNAVAPGAVEMPSEWKVTTPRKIAAIMERQCLKRRVRPDEVARAVLFLAGDDSSAVTGQTLNVDAGWVLR